jgi:hypothetical protein
MIIFNKNEQINLSVILIVIFFIVGVFFELTQSLSTTNIIFVECCFIFTFLIILFVSVKVSSILSVYSLFLILSFIFNYGRIFLELVTDYSYDHTDLFYYAPIEYDEKLKLILLMYSCLVFSFLSFSLFYKKSDNLIKPDYTLQKISKYIMIICSIPLVYNYTIELVYILKNGYLALFTGSMRENTETFLPSLVPRLFTFGFLLFIASIPSEKDFKKFMILYMSIMLFNALKGQRGDLLLNLVIVIWYFFNFYHKKINYKKILGIAVIILVVSESLAAFRVGKDIGLDTIVSAPLSFIENNGLSLNVPLYLIKFDEDLSSKGIPYLFAPIHDYFYRVFIDRSVFYNGPSAELLETSNFLPYHVINFINIDSFYNGQGTGTSYLAEFYDLGGIYLGGGLFFILVALIMQYERGLFKYRYLLFLSPIVVGQFIYMPRDAFFKIIDNCTPYTIGYLLLMLILGRYMRDKNA